MVDPERALVVVRGLPERVSAGAMVVTACLDPAAVVPTPQPRLGGSADVTPRLGALVDIYA